MTTETLREWTSRLCRPVHIITDAYGTDSNGYDFPCLEDCEAAVAGCIGDGQSLLPEDGLQEGEDFEFIEEED